MQDSAECTAIRVSSLTLVLSDWDIGPGSPSGNSLEQSGFAENLAPGIGISRALEKVAQFGAK